MIHIVVPLAQGFEELEAITITDILTRGGIQVTTASLDQLPVKASRGITVLADSMLNQLNPKDFDGIILPGGLPGANHLRDNQEINHWLTHMNNQAKLIGAICAGPKALIKAGITSGLSISAYPNSQAEFPEQTINDQAISQHQHIFTSKGPGTAMDFALALVEYLTNTENRVAVEQALMRS